MVKEMNFLQQNALHVSINKPKILEILLSHGFTEIVDSGDRDDTTPLMYAAAYGETKSVIALLRAGGNPCLLSNRQYLYFALKRGHFHLIESVYFYTKEGDPEAAQLVLDIALHEYVWGKMRKFTDRYSSHLRRLLELGARPKWISGKGNTIFHAIDYADEASLLLEFCSPPINCQNAIGHTPLMVLSWLLDIDLVRRLLLAGVPINTQDNSGRTVLEHLYQANRSRCTCYYCFDHCRQMKWVSTFQIAFDLLRAGADFGSPDCCTCSCSFQGCTALKSFLPNIHSQIGKKHNLDWALWIVELFLLLRGLHKNGLLTLIKSLTRRQRFDEIGLTHTCCLTLENSLYPLYFQCYNSPHSSAKSVERSENGNSSPVTEDHMELRGEQRELVEQLDEFCQSFANQEAMSPADCESALITTLARRIVFIERGMTQAASQSNLRRQHAARKPWKRSTDVSRSLNVWCSIESN